MTTSDAVLELVAFVRERGWGLEVDLEDCVRGGEPKFLVGAGMSAVWGIGLGFSGLLVVEFFGERIMAMLAAMFGRDKA